MQPNLLRNLVFFRRRIKNIECFIEHIFYWYRSRVYRDTYRYRFIAQPYLVHKCCTGQNDNILHIKIWRNYLKYLSFWSTLWSPSNTLLVRNICLLFSNSYSVCTNFCLHLKDIHLCMNKEMRFSAWRWQLLNMQLIFTSFAVYKNLHGSSKFICNFTTVAFLYLFNTHI